MDVVSERGRFWWVGCGLWLRGGRRLALGIEETWAGRVGEWSRNGFFILGWNNLPVFLYGTVNDLECCSFKVEGGATR